MVASNMLMAVLIFSIVYAGLCAAVLPFVINLLRDHGVVATNYKENIIPTSAGLFLWIMLITYYLLIQLVLLAADYTFIMLHVDYMSLGSYVISLSVVSAAGWLDDSIGDRHIKGFRGHWLAWQRERRVTTGLLKVAATSFAALFICIALFETLLEAMLQFFIIVLMTNMLNLFDLRPGRTLKVYFAMSLLVIIVGASSRILVYWLPIFIPAVIIFGKDVRAKLMLGDIGANVLGFSLGVSVVVVPFLSFQVIVLLWLIGIHWMAARTSISRVIDQHSFLKRLDHWGRG